MSLTSNNCMFIGLPSSGKSSFIGALWHVVLTGEIVSKFSVMSQPDDREYLNQLSESFLACKSPERTKTDDIKKINLSIKAKDTGQEVNFIFPDMSGETFRAQYAYRKISEDFLKEISDCSGIMLFVNPKYLKKSNIIPNFGISLDDLTPDEEPEEEENLEVKTSTEVEWSSDMSQTQVVLVDILQMIKKHVLTPCRICLIISAWDLIKDMPGELESNINPEEWIVKEVPLLHQFLTANNSIFTYETFGISAQGGKYAEGSFLSTEAKSKALDVQEQLQSKLKQSERIRVQYKDEISHDITIPINWLINGN